MANDNTTPIITASDLEVRYNDQIVLNRASLAICDRDRVGMVGRNGSGKSTFLKILTGLQMPDSGAVIRRKGLVVGYLSQDFTLDPAKNIYENIHAGAMHVIDLIHEFESLPSDSKRHSEVEDRIMALDGWGLEQRIQTAMSHLNVPEPTRGIAGLSGGEKRRVAICRAVVSRPDLLILDEPTNHLDPESIEWLGEYLLNFPGAFMLVTHDRYFLDKITSSIVELANGIFYSYTGNYSDYLEAKAIRQATEETVEHKRQSFIRRELEWVRRGPKAQTSKAKARLDQFYEIADKAGPVVEGEVELIIPPPPPLGNRIVDLTNIALEIGGNVLFRNLTFNFEAGMKIGITGRNGLGKTSLLKAILGDLQPSEGTVKTGTLTKFNYVDQSRLQLNDEKTVLAEISDGTEFVVFGNGRLSLRAYLKRFLFTDDRITTLVKYLSGGERSRLLLARILKNGGNFLILDEPTNDLDLSTLRILEEALLAFSGVVLVVSHDRYFLDRVCTGILAFEGNQTVSYSVGGYGYYQEKKARQSAPSYQSRYSQSGPPPASKPATGRKLTWKETRELEGMEQQILEAEGEVARLEETFANPDFHRLHGQQSASLLAQLQAAKDNVSKLYQRWTELEALNKAARK